MTEITIKQDGTEIVIRLEGGKVSVNTPEQTEPINLDQDFMMPTDRAANVNDRHEDVTAARNDEFVRQFANNLTPSPIYGDTVPELVTEDVLQAVDTVSKETTPDG